MNTPNAHYETRNTTAIHYNQDGTFADTSSHRRLGDVILEASEPPVNAVRISGSWYALVTDDTERAMLIAAWDNPTRVVAAGQRIDDALFDGGRPCLLPAGLGETATPTVQVDAVPTNPVTAASALGKKIDDMWGDLREVQVSWAQEAPKTPLSVIIERLKEDADIKQAAADKARAFVSGVNAELSRARCVDDMLTLERRLEKETAVKLAAVGTAPVEPPSETMERMARHKAVEIMGIASPNKQAEELIRVKTDSKFTGLYTLVKQKMEEIKQADTANACANTGGGTIQEALDRVKEEQAARIEVEAAKYDLHGATETKRDVDLEGRAHAAAMQKLKVVVEAHGGLESHSATTAGITALNIRRCYLTQSVTREALQQARYIKLCGLWFEAVINTQAQAVLSTTYPFSPDSP
jgi:hypothetical protein